MELQKGQAKHWFNRAEPETMLWSRKRKAMRNRANGNRVSVQRQRLLNGLPAKGLPEPDEQSYRLERDAVIAFQPFEHSHDAVQPLGDRSLPPIGIVRRKKGGDRGLCNQGLRLALTCGVGLKASEDLSIEIDAELSLFHITCS